MMVPSIFKSKIIPYNVTVVAGIFLQKAQESLILI
jgi:hypothetical protein